MSANNALTIGLKSFEVRYYPCADDEEYEVVGKGKTLEEAVRIAVKFINEELGRMLEYGVSFVDD